MIPAGMNPRCREPRVLAHVGLGPHCAQAHRPGHCMKAHHPIGQQQGWLGACAPGPRAGPALRTADQTDAKYGPRRGFPDRGAKKRGSAASLDWSTESAGLRHLAARRWSRRAGRLRRRQTGEKLSRRAKSPAPVGVLRETAVRGCLLDHMVLVDLRRLCCRWAQHTAQDLSHRPLQSRPHMGGRDSGGRVAHRPCPGRTGGSQGAGAMICTDNSPTPAPGGLLRTARLQRWQARLRSVRREREQWGFGQTRALAQGRQKP